MQINETRELLELLELDDIYFLHLEVNRADNSNDSDLDTGPRLEHEVFIKHHDRAISVRLRTTVDAKDAIYDVDVVTDYESPTPFSVSEDIRKDFVERVAIMAAWPYLRMAVSDMSARMRTEQISLGFYRVGDIQLSNPRPADPITGVPLEPLLQIE